MGFTKCWCLKHHLVTVAEHCYNSADRWRWHNVAQDYVKLLPTWQQTLWGSSSSLPSVRGISCISGCPHQVTKTYLPSRKGWRKGLMWYFSHQDSPLTTPDSIFNANEHKSLGWKEGRKGQQAISESRPTTEKQLVFRLPRCSAFAWTRDFMMLLPPTSRGDWEINTPFTETTKVKVVWTGANCQQARTKASQIWLSLHYS